MVDAAISTCSAISLANLERADTDAVAQEVRVVIRVAIPLLPRAPLTMIWTATTGLDGASRALHATSREETTT